MIRPALSAVLAGTVLALTCAARAEEITGTAQSVAQQTLNPLAYSINLPVALTFGLGPDGDTQPTLSVQPLIPLRLTEHWRLVTRANLEVVHLPAPEGPTGLGDIDVSVFLTPARAGEWVWGVGPILQLPTATDTALGTGKWSAGATAVLVYVAGPWVNGILVSHLWSFAGPRRRQDVSLTQMELQLAYTHASGWYVLTNPTLSYDWQAPRRQAWTIPIGVDVGKTFTVGSRGMSLQVGAYYNVERPAGVPQWVLQTQLSWVY